MHEQYSKVQPERTGEVSQPMVRVLVQQSAD
jgi:hypothetical protein